MSSHHASSNDSLQKAQDPLDSVPTSQLEAMVRRQAEYLFSAANLERDTNLRQIMAKDASGQGACAISTVVGHMPRLKHLVAELTERNFKELEAQAAEHAIADRVTEEEAKAAAVDVFMRAVKPSKVLVTNLNTLSVKRNVFLPAAPPLFDPNARPPSPSSLAKATPPEPYEPRRIEPRVWFPAATGWEEEAHVNATASTQPRGNAFGAPRRQKRYAWRAVTPQERAKFKWADYVVREMWQSGGFLTGSQEDRLPEIDQWDPGEFFMTADQLRQLEARRQFTFLWRGEPEASKRLKLFQKGPPPPLTAPSNDPDGDPFGLPAVLERERNRVRHEKDALDALFNGLGSKVPPAPPRRRRRGEEEPVPGGQQGLGGLATQLQFWQLSDQSESLDLAAQDLDPGKVPALAAFIAATRNCVKIDIRSNPRLSASDGAAIAKALLRNFESRPAPKFLTSPPPPPPPVDPNDDDAVANLNKLQIQSMEALRAVVARGLDASQVGACLETCFNLGVPPSTDLERAQDLFLELLAAVGSRCPNKGSILSFNAMPVHTFRSGTAKVADLSKSALGATDVTILLALLSAPFSNQSSAASLAVGASTILSAGEFAHPSVGPRTVQMANRLDSDDSLPGRTSNSSFAGHETAAGGGGGGRGSGGSASGGMTSILKQYRPLAPANFIEELNLSGNESMGAEGAKALASAIGAHDFPVLRLLGLGGCGIDADGFEYLADALRLHGETVQELDLSMNRGGPRGLTALAERYLFPMNATPRYATAAEGAVGKASPQPPKEIEKNSPSPMSKSSQGQEDDNSHDLLPVEASMSMLSVPSVFDNETAPAGRAGNAFNSKNEPIRYRELAIEVLRLTNDVGAFTDRGDDLSGVETLAACLVHPDAACTKLDLLYLGGAPLPVKHLRGLPVDQCGAEATKAATTFQRGRVLPRPDTFAEARYEATGGNGEFDPPPRGSDGDNNNSKNAEQKRRARRARRAGNSDDFDASGSRGNSRGSGPGSSGSAARRSEEVRPSQMRERFAARLAQGPRLGGRSYPTTNFMSGGTSRDQPLLEIDLSLQGTVLSVEDSIVIAALVEENYSLQVLRLNSHRPLPVRSLRGDQGHILEILDFSNSFWHAQEVLVAARLLRHNRAVKTLRLCDNPLCTVLGSGAGSAYPRSGLGDLCKTLTPPMRGLHGPQLSVVGRPPPVGDAKRRHGGGGLHLLGVVEDRILREGRPPLYDPTNWYTACRPDFVDLSVCGITSSGGGSDSTASLLCANPYADPKPLDLLKPVLRGLYCWGLEHALQPDSLVLIRKDRMPAVDAHLRAPQGTVPDRLSSPYSPYRKQRAKRGGVKHLHAMSADESGRAN